FSSRRRHTRSKRDWSSDVCSSDLVGPRTESPWTGGPSWQAIGGVLAAGALLVEIVVVIGLKAGGDLAHSHDVGGAFGTPSYIGQIGRASCRERGEVWGGAGSVQ